ncbi:GTP pyrophosphokinase [Congzhengia minquanensis]|uniref:GTP pyrophosphokinase family protein n=1 Tax=Congzhengia minquanensis TaxID=2763657 RepID=A0A926DP32_9FIRM|nr:GTP pyrophosphokinase family protein [Congzhengia minquanensis]MBC8540690.1 GTP pyrophosphokinase family protein [Congzhengia minquanensis]
MQESFFDGETMLLYEGAVIELTSRFEIMQRQIIIREKRNAIKNIYSRIKSDESICGKLFRKKLPKTAEAAQMYLNDIAGLRVIVGFIDDVYQIAEALKKQEDINILSERDYIKNPKPNGYRSYHLVVNLPVRTTESSKRVNAEIQLRTIAMDFWASLEHEMKYKKHIQNQDLICSELKRCADEMASADVDMQAIRDMIAKGE